MNTQTTDQATDKKFLNIKKNVSNLERIVMVLGGTYILYKGLSSNKNQVTKSTLGTSMLVRGVSGYCPFYDAIGNLKEIESDNVNIRINTVVKKPVQEVYEFWRDLQNLPKFMTHLESIKTLDQDKSEWTAVGPAGIGKITWKAEILRDEKNKFLSWKSLEGSPIKNVGKIAFKSIGENTEIDVTISYHAPFGIAGEKAAKLLNPYFEKKLEEEILNFKKHLES